MMSNSVFAPRHVYFPATEHTTTVIYLHDRNSTGPELAEHFARSVTSSEKTLYRHFPGTRWVFPSARAKHFYWTQADRQQLSQNNKDNTTEWFQLKSPTDVQLVAAQQLATLQESTSYILRIIDDELERVGRNPRRIFLAGIGQGMALGLVVLLCVHHQLGGFVGLNGWIPFGEDLASLIDQARVEEAGSFFKSNFIAAAQQTYIQQRQQQSMKSDTSATPDSVHSSPKPFAQPIAEVTVQKVAVPEHVKTIPLILSDSQEETQLTDPVLGAQAFDLMKQIGFLNISWKPSQVRDQERSGQGGERDDFDLPSLKVPDELKDMIGFFEDLRLAV